MPTEMQGDHLTQQSDQHGRSALKQSALLLTEHDSLFPKFPSNGTHPGNPKHSFCLNKKTWFLPKHPQAFVHLDLFRPLRTADSSPNPRERVRPCEAKGTKPQDPRSARTPRVRLGVTWAAHLGLEVEA